VPTCMTHGAHALTWSRSRGQSKSMRRTVFLLLGLIAFVLVLLAVAGGRRAPANDGVAQRFHRQKAVYEQLRDMLREDEDVRQIARWGIRTEANPLTETPSVAELSADRYQKYLTLLSTIGALGMTRSNGDDPEICILMWASGWAADTFHVSVCWLGRDVPMLASGYRSFSLSGQWHVERDDM